MKSVLAAFAISLAGFFCSSASAQDYPAKPVRVVVPYVAGGNADIWARTLGQKLTEAFKQPFVIENRPGANGGIGADLVARSAPDGYTLLATASGPIVVNPVLYAKVPYDPVKDFAPVAQCVLFQYVLVTLAAAPYKGIGDLVSAARANPGALAYGSTGIGGGNHLAGELFALGAGAKRASALPEVPTMQEAGMKDFDIFQWQGVLAPAGTPRAIVERLNGEIVKAMHAPDVRERIVTQGGSEIVTGSAEEFGHLIKNELQQYARLIREANIPSQ